MDSSFENRVLQTFGSLGSALPSWRLSDQQSHRHSWISGRHRSPSRDDTPCSASFEQLSRTLLRSRHNQSGPLAVHGSCAFDGLSAADRLQDDVDGDFDGRDLMDVEGQDAFRSAVVRIEGTLENEEEEGRQMRRIVGLDTTLDLEEEEDEFDIAAVGGEGDAKRMYMSEVKGLNIKVDESDCLPLSFYDLKSAPRDPRANHVAAKARLEEDARDAATSCTNLTSSETDGGQNCVEEEHVASENSEQSIFRPESSFVVDTVEHSVIKTKRSSCESEMQEIHIAPRQNSENKIKPIKRVRFALDTNPKNEAPVCHKMNTKQRVIMPRPSRVPDYVKNPSKYTHYTLDWSNEDNEESNIEAFKACADMTRRNREPETTCAEPEEMPQKIQFIPRVNKSSVCLQKSPMGEDYQSLTRPIRFAMFADDSETDESLGTSNRALDMYVTEENLPHSLPERKSIKGPKQYRSRKGVAESEQAMEI